MRSSSAVLGAAARTMFDDIVRQHEPSLRGYARKLSGNDADAGDLVQDSLERALRGFDPRTPPTNPRAWLCTILYNVFVDRVRQRRSRPTAPLEGDPAAEEPVTPPRWTTITREQLDAAMAQLEGEFRVVCQLRLVDGLSYEEIAERLAVPRSTVGTRLLRARDKLRVLLEAHVKEAP